MVSPHSTVLNWQGSNAFHKASLGLGCFIMPAIFMGRIVRSMQFYIVLAHCQKSNMGRLFEHNEATQPTKCT
jgi:hypothetical protein